MQVAIRCSIVDENMSITSQVLGGPGHDNALFVRVEGGQAMARLLFDCGEGCLRRLNMGETIGLDAVFFSHLHMDHIAGFDTFIRRTFNRPNRPVQIYGPPGTIAIVQHRLRGFWWNMYQHLEGVWHVHDIYPTRMERAMFRANEAFAHLHPLEEVSHTGTIYDGGHFHVSTQTMEHHGPSLAYVVRERPRSNVDLARLAALNLTPGEWLQRIKSAHPDTDTLMFDDRTFTLGELRAALLTIRPGRALAYLTDFLLDEAAIAQLLPFLGERVSVVCESQYLHQDAALALQHHHMLAIQVGQLAHRAQAEALTLFHLSDRYTPAEQMQLLQEARQAFPAAQFPPHWHVAAEPM